MTATEARARVLQRYPKAKLRTLTGEWCVFNMDQSAAFPALGLWCGSKRSAWISAARRLEKMEAKP